MKIHTDVRNYKCHTCGKAFYRAKALREHIRTHTKHLSVTYVGTDLRWQFISGCITTLLKIFKGTLHVLPLIIIQMHS